MHNGVRKRFKLTVLLSFLIVSKIFNSNKIECVDESYLYDEIDTNDYDKNISLEEIFVEEIIRREEVTENYISFFNNYEVSYNYKQFFLTEEDIDILYDEQSKNVVCNFKNSDNALTLYNKIVENSLNYVERNPQYVGCFVDNNFINKNKWNFRYIFNLVLNEHIKDSGNNIDEDICRMQDLIVVYDDYCSDKNILGWYDNELNIIYLCRNNIIDIIDNYLYENGIICNKNSKTYKDYLWNYYYWVFSHEFEHLCHTRCNCILEDVKYKNIFSYSMDNYGDYYVSVFSESSAESVFKNFNNDKNFIDGNMSDDCDYSYIDERELESLLLLFSLFDDNNISNYYKAIGDNDIDGLLEYLGLYSDEGKYLFYKLLYVIDGINGRSNLIDKYQRLSGDFVCYDDFYYYGADIGYGYRADIFRIVLSRMVNYTKSNVDFTLDESLLLFNFIKDKVVNETSYLFTRDGKLDFMYDDKFVRDILILEEEYINFLSEYYCVSVSLVRELDIKYMKNSSVILKTLVSAGDSSCYEIDKCNVALELLSKIPLLKYIVSSSDYIIGYERFLNRIDNNLIYESGKGLKLGI